MLSELFYISYFSSSNIFAPTNCQNLLKPSQIINYEVKTYNFNFLKYLNLHFIPQPIFNLNKNGNSRAYF